MIVIRDRESRLRTEDHNFLAAGAKLGKNVQPGTYALAASGVTPVDETKTKAQKRKERKEGLFVFSPKVAFE